MLKICGTTSLRAILVSAVVGFFQPAGEDPSQNITRSTYAYHHNHPATCCWFFKDCKQACLHRHIHNPSLCQAKYQCKHTHKCGSIKFLENLFVFFVNMTYQHFKPPFKNKIKTKQNKQNRLLWDPRDATCGFCTVIKPDGLRLPILDFTTLDSDAMNIFV